MRHSALIGYKLLSTGHVADRPPSCRVRYGRHRISAADIKEIFVEIRGTQGCALVGDPARAVGECRDVAKAQP